MSMYGIRNFGKKHGVLIGIVIVLLIASLLISYIAMGGRSASLSEEEQIKAQ